MAARGEDSLNQIQKYKALLALNRRKSSEEMAKKSKKNKNKKDNNKPVLQPLLEDDVITASNSGLINTEVKENMIVHDKNDMESISKGTAMTGTVQQSAHNSIALVSEPATTTSQLTTIMSANDKEVSEEIELAPSTAKVEENDNKEPEFEKSTKTRLSFRRKRKKSKASSPEADSSSNAAQEKKNGEKKEQENQPDSDGATKGACAPLAESTEINSPEPCETFESPTSDVKVKKKGSSDNKEKLSRTKKFKRWASFSKKKEEESIDSLNTKGKEKETKQKSDDCVQYNESMKDTEDNSKDCANNTSKMSKEERRKRSVSFAETVKYHDDDFIPEPEPRKRSASFGEDTTVEPFDIVVTTDVEEKETVCEPKETTTQDVEPEPDQANDDGKNNIESDRETEEISNVQNSDPVIENASLDKDNEDETNLESDAEQKDVKTDDEYTTATGDMTGEENDDKETKPKKKKKRFLRKLASKNIKGSKKENKSLTKSDISLPLELEDDGTTEDAAEQSEPEEKSQENSAKRKKSVLGLKLPKALKKRKSSSGYKIIAGADAEKELQKDEEHDKESIQDNAEKEENIRVQQATSENYEEPAEKTEEISKTEEQKENIEASENLPKTHDQLELCETHENAVQKDEDNTAQEPQVDKENTRKDENIDEKDQEIAVTPIVESDQQPAEMTTDAEETQPENITENNERESKIGDEIPSEQRELAEQEPETAEQKEYAEAENVDELQDSSLSVSEITLIEMGDESSLLAMPMAKDIHELPEVTQPEHDNTNDTGNQTKPTEPEVSSTPTPSEDSLLESNAKPSVSRPLSPECLSPDVCAKLRSFEMSVRTKAIVDSYILIDQQLEVSQDFLKHIELMDNREKNRCFVM